MKRLILMLALSIITLQATWAKLNVTQETDGTVVFTLEASGAINKEFTPVSGGYAQYTPSNLIKDYLTTTKLKVVTKTGVTMSRLKAYLRHGRGGKQLPQLKHTRP